MLARLDTLADRKRVRIRPIGSGSEARLSSGAVRLQSARSTRAWTGDADGAEAKGRWARRIERGTQSR
eukprot:1072147-Pleurochrysis_carterae.AAC.1